MFLSRLLCLPNSGLVQYDSFGSLSLLHICFLGLYYSVICSPCFAFRSYPNVLVTCAITFDSCCNAPAVASFSLKGCLITGDTDD